jgi:signal transduction histidine kinase
MSVPRELAAPPGAGSAVRETVESMMLEERTAWAMHVHDGLTQSVTSAVLEIQTLRHRIEVDPERAIDALHEVELAIRQDLSQIRELLFELHEGWVRHEPFAAFVEDMVERWKLPARVSIEGDVDDVPPAVLATAHHVVAEALTNAAKHSGSKDVAVRVRAAAEELRVEVEDRGGGIAAVTDDDPHFGLRSMRARTEEIGGSIEIASMPGRGVRVVAVLPVATQAVATQPVETQAVATQGDER